MEDEHLEAYVGENCEVYDRFAFDSLFKRLLAGGYGHEEAKDIILHSCGLSALVTQERFDNEYYLEISVKDEIAPDLAELKRELGCGIIENKILEIL